MDTLKNPNINFPVMSALTSTIVTFVLLIILSNLTHIERPPVITDRPPPILINDLKSPKPPEPARVEETEEMQFEPQIMHIPANDRPLPTILPPNSPTVTVWRDGPGITLNPGIERPQIHFKPRILDITQVDRKPIIIKQVKPLYPFSAKSKGIEGRVVLRFVVDEKGMVQEPEVFYAEPEGVFEEYALSAIVKYRFKPALVNKKPVKCIVNLPIGFELNQ